MQKFCTREGCGAELIEGVNWSSSSFKHGRKTCKACQNASRKAYVIRNPEKIKASQKRIRLKNSLDPEKKKKAKAYSQKYSKNNKEKRNEYSRNYHKKNLEKTLLRGAKYRAQKRDLEINIELADIVVPEKCPILNIPIIRGEGKVLPNSPTLDRIDSRKGYVKGNIQVISFRANTVKNDLLLEEIELLYKWAAKNMLKD